METLYIIFNCFYTHSKTSPQLLQLFRRMLQCCLTVMLQKCFVGFDTKPDFPSAWRWGDNNWIFISGWRVSSKRLDICSFWFSCVMLQRHAVGTCVFCLNICGWHRAVVARWGWAFVDRGNSWRFSASDHTWLSLVFQLHLSCMLNLCNPLGSFLLQPLQNTTRGRH